MPSACRIELPATHAGVQRARQVAAEQLQSWGQARLVEDVQLLVSELATNALLHAKPPMELVLEPTAAGVRVELSDGSRRPPLPAGAEAEAMTGRGLRLVRALASDWGVDPLPEGKVVWAEVSENGTASAAHLGEHELLAMWDDEETATAPDPGSARVRVSLEGVPTGLLVAAKTHVDNLVREFALTAVGAETGAAGPPAPGLAKALEAAVTEFAEARLALKRQAQAAQQRGLATTTLILDLPIEAADAAERYLAALGRVDAYCHEAKLLTLETPPEQRIFREWYVCEVVEQLRRARAGLPPAPTEPFEAFRRRARSR